MHWPFTLSTDGSNDSGCGKQFPIVVRTVNMDTNLVQSELLAVPVLEGSGTGEAIFNLLYNFLATHEVSWENCIGFGCDNAPVMVGSKKGVIAFIKSKNPNVAQMGCTLHLAHIAAERGTDILPASAFDLLVDIFYYLKKSSLRKHNLAEFWWFHDVDQEAILKHALTRWLSIGRCLDRLIKNWQPLKDFFRIEATNAKSDSKQASIFKRLRSPSTQLYMLFLQYATSLFQGFLTELQAEEPKIHLLRSSIHKVMRKMLFGFVKPSAMIGKEPQDVDYKNPDNLKAAEDLLIGEPARSFIANKSSNNLAQTRIDEFFPAVVHCGLYERETSTQRHLAEKSRGNRLQQKGRGWHDRETMKPVTDLPPPPC